MKVKIGMLPPVVAACAALAFACALPARADVTLTGANAEVVVAADAPKATQFAAQEMTNFLSRCLGRAVPLSTSPTAGRVPVILGTNGWSRAAGISLEGLPRDTFVISAGEGRIMIAGCDSPSLDPAALVASGNMRQVQFGERATLFGVYEFLERFAGCRFYFPGELGEVVPHRERIDVSVSVAFRSPSFCVRSVSTGSDGVWFGESQKLKRERGRTLNWFRLRLESDRKPFGHGQNGFNMIGRFKDSHPEYFRISKDGKRDFSLEDSGRHPFYLTRQLCHTSDVWKELEEDVVSYFKGEPPTKRNVLGKRTDWGNRSPFHDRKYVNIMPQDGMQRCWCERCRATFDDSRDYASELIWRRTVDVANRITREGLKGSVTQMAYRPYGLPPKGTEIPGNVEVQVAVGGPWALSVPESFAKQVAHVKAWRDKLGRPVSLWTYPCKACWFRPPIAPCVAPRAFGEFYRAVAPYIEGAFNESCCERYAYQYLNYYVFSRLAWDAHADVDAILAEHHRLMFGAAAKEMARFFDELEKVWIGKIAIPSLIPETMMGESSRSAPPERAIMGEIYSAAELGALEGMLDRAATAVPAGSLEARRVALMRAELFDPIATAARAWQRDRAVEPELKRRAESGVKGTLFEDVAGWRFRDGRTPEADAADFVTPPNSLKATAERGLSLTRPLDGVLKPGRKYRISFFMKTDLASPRNSAWDGACVEVSFGNGKFHRAPSMRGGYVFGKWGWTHFSNGFTAPDDLGAKSKPRLELRIFSANGPIRLDGLLVEPID